MNKYLTFLISIAFLLFFVGTVYANHGAKNISFPIPELGNCKNYTECRDYCVEPTHYISCRDWAKKNNIHSGDIPAADKKLAFDNARRTLGCDGQESCQTFCSKRENFNQCSDFSKKTGLVGGYMTDPSNDALLKRANEVLGCALDNECKSFCDREENREKCTSFAREVGIGGGIREVGPGGCTSKETCQAFCQDPQNKDKCAGFITTPSDIRGEPPFPYSGKEKPGGEQVSDQNPGPGGCTSEKDCDAFCSDPKNAEECKKFEESSGYQWSGPGGCTSAQSCAAYCRSNYKDPECGGGADAGEYEAERQKYESQYKEMLQQRQQKEDEFRQMEGQKKQYEQQMMDAEGQKQQKYQEMEGAQQQYQQKQQEMDSMQGQYDQRQQEFNQMQQMQQQAPSGVQGASTNRGLLQIFLDNFLRR